MASTEGNLWLDTWNVCNPVPVSEQVSLFDPLKEAELALHYLEAFSFQEFLEQ